MIGLAITNTFIKNLKRIETEASSNDPAGWPEL